MSTKVWEDESPAAKFWERLIRERAIEFMRCPEYLKKLRHDYDRAKSDQKMFGQVWEEYGTNVFQLIAEAHGETWDAEDEEKHCVKKEVAVIQREPIADDDLARTREESAREWLDLVQGKPEESVSVLEEEQGRSEIVLKGGSCCTGAEEETRTKEEEEEMRRMRREDFYRRAGGT